MKMSTTRRQSRHGTDKRAPTASLALLRQRAARERPDDLARHLLREVQRTQAENSLVDQVATAIEIAMRVYVADREPTNVNKLLLRSIAKHELLPGDAAFARMMSAVTWLALRAGRDPGPNDALLKGMRMFAHANPNATT
jgi:hypothetical protein